jgi:signal transduction histidine kinase
MPWTAQQKLRLGFWLLAFIPVVLGVVAFRNAHSLANAAEDVAQTNEIVKALEVLLSELKDVEVAQSEYVLTGNERHIADLERSRGKFDAGVERLRKMRADVHWITLLESLIPQKFDEVKKTIELRKSGGMQAASQAIAGGGPPAMENIRRVIRNMILEENRQLNARTAAQRQSFINTMVLFALVLVVNLSLIWLVAYRVTLEQQTIRALNEDLERRVELRTAALQRSNEDLQQFAYVASHDLKEPLRMIASYSTLLQRRYRGKLDPDADTFIGFITDGVKRMSALISDLLEYSRAGEIPGEAFETVDTAAVMTNVLANLKVTITESRATITVGELPMVMYDPMSLTQILQNLVGNAIKYRGEERPAIEVSASRQRTETVFSVKDNGMGIDPDDIDKIFGIFKRLHGKEFEGTGIGLAMVKKIVERQGGRIWVESSPGSGSTFHFTVPHAKSALAESTTA